MRVRASLRNVLSAALGVVSRAQRSRKSVLELPGLTGPVEVHTDELGVSHIYADDAGDLFFAQGYVTARDRHFQIDYNRHAAAGRLCELVGRRRLPWRELTVQLKDRTTLDADVMLRTFGMARLAAASLPLHSPEARAIL